jgi:hypothetical protein
MEIIPFKVLINICVQNLLDTSHLQVNGGWNLLWLIKAPSKVKNMLWRIWWSCIPSWVRLQAKGVERPTICALWKCGGSW